MVLISSWPPPPNSSSLLKPSRTVKGRGPLTGSVRSFQAFLRRHSLVFACAESCTGGLLCREMTTLAGSSDVFWGGVVTYADEAKVRLLGVPADLIRDHGAVSGPVAAAMVRGILLVSGVPLAVAVTGVAGPGGGSPEKPVGTLWFGLAGISPSGVGEGTAVAVRFSGTRGQIQRQAAVQARQFAALWWESGMDLDRFLSLTDNDRKHSIEAFLPTFLISPNPL